MPDPKAETTPVSGTAGKDLVNKDGSVTKLIEWATENAATPEEILDMFEESGIPVSHGEEITGDYTVVHGDTKEDFCTKMEGEKLFVVQWHFYESATGEFAAMHLVSRVGKFILNDSAKGGMYGQLRKITDKRESTDATAETQRTSTAGLMVARGLRRNNPFYFDTRPKSDEKGKEHQGRAIPKLGLNDVEKYPMNFRELSKPTWSFDL